MARLGIRGTRLVIQGLMGHGRPFRQKELLQHGVSPASIGLHSLLLIDRLDRGVYGQKGRYFPRVAIAMERVPQSWACLYSALWLHELLDEEPAAAWLCRRRGAWKPLPGMVPTEIVRTSLWPHREDVCSLTRWALPSATLARTVFDFHRLRHRVGVTAAHAAIKLVRDSGKCTEAEIEACAERYRRPPPGTSSPL